MPLYRRFFFVLTVVVLAVASCTKPILIGSDFLEDEKSSLKFSDTLDLSFFTEKTDSIIVHSNNLTNQLTTYLVGNIVEPVFGKYTAEIFAQPILPTVASELKGSILDSVILQLRYDTLGNYGSLTDPVTLEVYRMIENPAFEQKYFSNERFLTSPSLLGSLTFIPQPKDSVTLDTVKYAPHVRIALSLDVMNEFLTQDDSIFTNQDKFLEFFSGLHIKMTGANNTMLGFNLLNPLSGMNFYYDKGTATDRQFKFVFTAASIKTVYMEHDYTGSLAEASLTPEPENDYWFVQGMSGLTTKMKINNLSDLDNIIINLAELEVFVTFLDGDNPVLYPPFPYLVTQESTDSTLINTDDVNAALFRANNNNLSATFETLYGGKLELVSAGDPVVYRYNMKITAQVKEIYEGEQENIIYFNPFQKADVPGRSVMFGPNHQQYAPRLRIYYTAL